MDRVGRRGVGVTDRLEAARDRFVAEQSRLQADLGVEAAAVAALRAEGLRAFEAQGLPHTRLEEWRYTSVAPIANVAFARPGDASISRDAVEALAFPLFACGLFVFVNGRHRHDLSVAERLTGRVRVESLGDLRASGEGLESLGAQVALKEHPFAALNTACLEDGAVIRVPRGVVDEQPLHLVFVAADEGAPVATHPRVSIVAEPGSRITVIQDHVSVGSASGFTNALTEIHVGENAEVHYVVLQREHDAHFHVGGLHVRQDRASRFSSHTLTLGGALVRNDATVLLAEEGAACRLDGLFIAGADHKIDNHTLVDHAVPHCSSHELYKGVLGGSARGVFRGRVIVRPHAQKTSATQSNPNLLIGRGAEIDTKPQLEIYADDVRCSHGSTIGQLDDDALFYLRSRGIPEANARELLIRAFAGQVLEALPVPGLAKGLDETIDARLLHARGGTS
jgi:Fe-S cluster assembly protein SufD